MNECKDKFKPIKMKKNIKNLDEIPEKKDFKFEEIKKLVTKGFI